MTIEGIEDSNGKHSEFALYLGFIVQNQLNLLGYNALNNRLFLVPSINSLGRKTITAENVYAENVDFSEIIGAGAADWDLSAIVGGAGDGGGNQDIIFTPAKTSYWFKNSGDYFDTTKWYSETNGGGVNNRIPMIHDHLIFDENSFDEVSEIVIGTMLADINSLAITYNVTLLPQGSLYGASNTFGNLRLGPMVTGSPLYNYGLSLYLRGEGTYGLNCENVILGLYLMTRGTINLESDILCYNFNSRSQNYTIFRSNDFDITIDQGAISISFMVGYFGNSTIRLKGNNSYNRLDGTIYYETSTIVVEPTSGTFSLSIRVNASVNNMIFDCGANVVVTVTTSQGTGNVTFNTVTVMPGFVLVFMAHPTSKYRFTELIAAGTSGSNVTIRSNTPGSQCLLQNLAYADLALTYCTLKDINASGVVKIKSISGKLMTAIKSVSGTLKAAINKIGGVKMNSGWTATSSIDQGNNTGIDFL